jgi:HEAT repeat protein
VLFSAGGIMAAEPGDEDAETLRSAGVLSAPEDLARFLRSLAPSAEYDRKTEQLIEQLGSDKFQAREDASAALAAMLPLPVEALRRAEQASDPEIRIRAKRILASDECHRGSLVEEAALRLIRRRQIKGLAPLMIQAAELWTQFGDTPLLRRALAVTARPEDADLLRATIRDASQQPSRPDVDAEVHGDLRQAAIEALANALGASAAVDLKPLLVDSNLRIRFTAARSLANLGQHEALDTLIGLLDADDLAIRSDSNATLSELTGQHFSYIPSDNQAARAAAVAAWKQWLAKNGATATLHFPLREAPTATGHILICSFAEKRLVEIDQSGKTIVQSGDFEYPWGCCVEADGRRLAVDYNRRYVVEYDASGRERWRKDNLPGGATDVKSLDSGRILLALPETGEVIEIDRNGQTVWKAVLAGRPTTAQRLENGNTLVNLQNAGEVVELDRQQRIVWRLKGLQKSHTAQALENGNVLICEMDSGKVAEYDRSGSIVWSKDGFSNPAQAQRIADGQTLVADEAGLHKIDPAGKETWNFRTARSRFCAF